MNALNILAHQAQKFGVVTVIDAVLFDRATGEAILELDTLKMANITAEAEEKEIRGGQAATQLIIYNYAKTATMEMQDALASISSLEYLFGADLKAGSDVVKHVKESKAVATNAMILGSEPIDGTKVTVYGPGATEGDPGVNKFYTVGDTTGAGIAVKSEGSGVFTLTFPTGEIPNGTYNIWYETPAGAGAQSITLASDSFTANVKLVGKTFIIDQRTGQRKAAEVIIHNFKLDPTFELMFDSEGEASVFDFSGKALEDPDTKAMITLTYLDEITGFSLSLPAGE
jgi:hypothetical protein